MVHKFVISGGDVEEWSLRRFINSMALKWIWWNIFCFSLTVGSAEEKKLFKDLFGEDGYVPNVRPRMNPGDVIVIEIDFEVNQIKDLNEQSQTLYTVGFIQAEWEDDYLKWNPDNYSGIREIILPPNQVWLPDFGIQNSAETFYQDDFFDHFRVHVKHTGRMTWAFGGVFETTCRIDTVLFPFDTQSCPIVLENWAYTNRSVNLVNNSAGVKLDTYHENGIWTLIRNDVRVDGISYGMHPDETYPQIRFVLHLQRKPRYYLVNILLPCIFLTSIALLVFWLPTEAGEKVSLGITVLLAFSVFQLIIANSTPANSDSTPILSIFVTLTMFLSTVSVLTTVLVLHLHHREPSHRLPKWLRVLAVNFLPRLLCMSLAKKKNDGEKRLRSKSTTPILLTKHGNDSIQMMTITSEDGDGSRQISPAFRALSKQVEEVTAELRLLTARLHERDAEKEVLLEWQILAKVLDRLFFWIVLLVLLGACSWLIYVSLRTEHNFDA